MDDRGHSWMYPFCGNRSDVRARIAGGQTWDLETVSTSARSKEIAVRMSSLGIGRRLSRRWGQQSRDTDEVVSSHRQSEVVGTRARPRTLILAHSAMVLALCKSGSPSCQV